MMFNNPANYSYTRNGLPVRWRHGIAMIGLVLMLVRLATAAASASDSKPGVFPPDSNPYEISYGEWSTRWWQYVSGVPAPHNPLFDETGADCATGQSGKVWFLVGKFLFEPNNTATRHCTVPKDTALLLPIVGAENDNFTCLDPDTTLTVAQLRAAIKTIQDGATDLALEVDGVAVPNLGQYRVASPVFSLTLPENNFVQSFGCTEGAGIYGPAISDGYWVMLKPLAVGEHTIHFHANLGSTLDITYHITVINQSKSQLRAFVYDDKTRLGHFNTGDKAQQGWDVVLYDANGVQVGTQRSNGKGKVSFPLLTPGAYTLCEDLLPGWTNTQPASVHPTYLQPCYTQTLTPGQLVEVRFGNHHDANIVASALDVDERVFITDLSVVTNNDEETIADDAWLTTEEAPNDTTEADANGNRQNVYLPMTRR